jgi:hypothetical protein
VQYLKHKTDWMRTEDFESEVDSDFGLDLNAIKHLTGDIADNVSGFDGSPLMDFKPTPRHRNLK